jgi:hypothetical protein
MKNRDERYIEALMRRFKAAPDEALFSRPEVSLLLNMSMSALQKGFGPAEVYLGRHRKSTKKAILEFVEKKENSLLMTEAKARRTLRGFIQPDDRLSCCNPLIQWPAPTTDHPNAEYIVLDDTFSIDEIEAIAWWMAHMTVEDRNAQTT